MVACFMVDWNMIRDISVSRNMEKIQKHKYENLETNLHSHLTQIGEKNPSISHVESDEYEILVLRR